MASKTFPYVEKALFDYLEKVFPNSLPVKLLSEAELARLIGQQDVINRLRQIHSEQIKQELGGS